MAKNVRADNGKLIQGDVATTARRPSEPGYRSGRLVVIEVTGRGRYPNGRVYTLVRVKCDCGSVVETRTAYLRKGKKQSCGCLKHESAVEMGRRQGRLNAKHGMFGTPFYGRWAGACTRCHNPNSNDYHRYGARNITVCDRWRSNFVNFMEDMLPSYEEHVAKFGEKDTTLERIDVNKGYSPGNCIWATRKEQNNNRRNSKKYTYSGESKTLRQWSDDIGFEYELARQRIHYGWSFEEAMFTPSGAKVRRNGR